VASADWPSGVRTAALIPAHEPKTHRGSPVLIGKVVGTIVATQKDEKLDGLRFMVVRQMTVDGKDTNSYVVAVDAVGSGVGETVLYATGSSARQTTVTDKRPCDAVIMAIVDTWEVDGEVRYQKDGES